MTSLARDEALVREALEGPRSEEMRYGSHVTQARVSITVADLREALAALARIVGQAEQLRELVSDLAAALRPSTGHHVECQAERHTGSKNCNCGFERNRVLLERVAALAGVTDNERTAEETQ